MLSEKNYNTNCQSLIRRATVQINRRNNLEIQQGIPANVTDDELEGKVIDISRCHGIKVKGTDIEDYHRLDNANPKNTINYWPGNIES